MPIGQWAERQLCQNQLPLVISECVCWVIGQKRSYFPVGEPASLLYETSDLIWGRPQ